MQNVRLRRLTLRAVGVAPQQPAVITYVENALMPRAKEIEAAREWSAMPTLGQTLRHAARSIVALNLHLLHCLKGEKLLLSKLDSEMRSLASLVLGSRKEWDWSGVQEPLHTLCFKLAIDLVNTFVRGYGARAHTHTHTVCIYIHMHIHLYI